MKKGFGVTMMILLPLLNVFFGAEKLGLLNASHTVLSTAYVISLICYAVFAYTAATMSGDALAAKYFGYDPDRCDKRWTGYAAGDSYVRQGAGMRFVLHFCSQVPLLFFVAIFVQANLKI